MTRRRRSTADWIVAAMACVRTLPPGAWVAAAMVVIGGTLLRLATAPPPGEGAGPAALAAGIVQLAAVLLLDVMLYRAMAGGGRGSLAGALLRFALFLAAQLVLTMALLAVARALLPTGAMLADIWLWSFAATALAGVLLLPLAPWGAALALGDRWTGAAGGWAAIRRGFPAFAGAWTAVVGPALAIHLMLTMLLDDPGSTLAGTALIGVVAVDSVASLAQAVLTVALGTAAWTVARGRAEAVHGASFDN